MRRQSQTACAVIGVSGNRSEMKRANSAGPPASSMARASFRARFSSDMAAVKHCLPPKVKQYLIDRKARVQSDNRLRTAIGTMRHRKDEEQRAAAQADDQARRNAALQYMLNQRAPQAPTIQPYQAPIPRPSVTTNCYRFGDQVTCTSR